MTAQITQQLRLRDNREVIEAKIAQILLEESAAQVAMAPTGAVIEYSRAGSPQSASDYIVTPSHSGIGLGTYTATAGALVAGVGKWTLVPPGGGDGEEIETEDAEDDLVFSETGLTLAVTGFLTPWKTGDVIAAMVVDADDYRIKVYSGRCNPIHNWLENADLAETDTVPRVQVWFDRQSFDKSKSDVFTKQQGPGTFWIDVYGYGRAYETESGHVPAGTVAGNAVSRVLSLVRQCLMAAHYVTLGLEGTVGERFPDLVEFMPVIIGEGIRVEHVAAARLTLSVDFPEFAPQVIGEPLEIISTTIYRQEDGEVLMQVKQDWSGE